MKKFNRVLVFSTVCFLLIILLFFISFSKIIHFAVKDQTSLRKGNLMRKFYLKIPIPLSFKVYFFNISNPEEVKNGATPMVKEIGPYYYDAYKEKIETLDNEGEDSLTYTPYETYFFNKFRSRGLSDNDYVTVLHPLIVGIVNTVTKDSPLLLPVVNRALKTIFNNPQNIYLTTKVKDILFEGITINCTIQDFSSSAVCSQIKSQVPGLVETKKNLYKFSILGSRNGTLPNRFKILRGVKKSHELGRLVELNHYKESQVWNSKKCNRFRGTDGWIFPPLVKKEVGIWTYSKDICKNVHLVYIGDEKFHGLSVEKYYSDLGDMTKPEEKCYCLKTCLPKGIMDLTKCSGVPIYATLPHFLRVDKNIQKTIKGFKPVTDQHIIRILMQPLLGVPVEAQKRIQFNMPIQANKKISFMNAIPEAVHPIFWIEESIVLEGTLLKLVKTIFVALKVVDVVKYCLLAVSLGGIGYGGYLHYKELKRDKVTPVRSITTGSKKEEMP